MDKKAGSLVAMVLAVRGAMARVGLGPQRVADRQVKILETIAVGPRKHLVLVSCCGEKFLVGTGAESIAAIVRVSNSAGSELP